MIKRIKKLWMNTLRSNKYLQGKYALKKKSCVDGKFHHCCLGVLCEVVKDEVHTTWRIPEDDPEYRQFDGCKVDLPNKVLEKTKLTPDQVADLIQLNDKTGQDFNEIADWIEENL